MNKEDFMSKYNLKKAENTEDYQIDNETIIKELQERIDKAIEYIEKQEDYYNNYPLINRQGLLDILKGGNNE